MFTWKVFRSKWLAIGWLILISVLFFLPGSAFPRENWFSKIYIDKWVHVGLFAVLLFLWRSAFNYQIKNYHLVLLGLALLYGFMVEVIQRDWIPNRDFDLYDVIADMTGSLLGLLIWSRVYKKNRPL